MRRQFVFPNLNIGNSGYTEYYLQQLNGNDKNKPDNKSSSANSQSSTPTKDKNGYSANFDYNKRVFGGYNSKPLTEIAQNKAKKAHASGGGNGNQGDSAAMDLINNITSGITDLIKDHSSVPADADAKKKEVEQTEQETEKKLDDAQQQVKTTEDDLEAVSDETQAEIQDAGDDSQEIVDDNEAIDDDMAAATDEADTLVKESEDAADDLKDMGVDAPDIETADPAPDSDDSDDATVDDDTAKPTDGDDTKTTEVHSDNPDAQAKIDLINSNNARVADINSQIADLSAIKFENIGKITANNEAIDTSIARLNEEAANAKLKTSQITQQTTTSTQKTITSQTQQGTQAGAKAVTQGVTSGNAAVAEETLRAEAEAANATGVGSGAGANLEQMADKAGETKDNTSKGSKVNAEIGRFIASSIPKLVGGIASQKGLQMDFTQILTDAVKIGMNAAREAKVDTPATEKTDDSGGSNPPQTPDQKKKAA